MLRRTETGVEYVTGLKNTASQGHSVKVDMPVVSVTRHEADCVLLHLNADVVTHTTSYGLWT